MKNKYQIVLLFASFIFTFGIRLYWFIQKDGFHVDEGLSITLACYNDYMWTKNYEFNKEYTGKEVKEISLCDNDSLRDAAYDIYRLWKDNRDSPHTNLYYSLLRLSLTGLKTGDIKKIIFRGAILNVSLFIVSFYFFFLLLMRSFKSEPLPASLAALCTFLSTATISNTLLLRPYQLQETGFIVFCYFYITSINQKKYMLSDGMLYVRQKFLTAYSCIASITLLTGYYAVIFIGAFGLYTVWHNHKKRYYNEITTYVVIFFNALIIAQVLYPRYIFGFLSSRSTETTGTIFKNFSGNIYTSFLCIAALLKTYYSLFPVIVLCIAGFIYLVYNKKKIIAGKPASLIFAVALLYMIVVLIIAPYKTLRYVMPVFPFLIFLPMMIFCSFKDNKASIPVMLLLIICFAVNGFNIKNIENVYKDKPDNYAFEKEKDIPVLVLNKTFWKYAELIPYFNDDQVYFFNDSFESLQTMENKTFYLITEDTPEIRTYNPQNYKIILEFTVPYFLCRKLSLLE